MAGTTRLELATSAVTVYNNLQNCGDCQGSRKALKIAQDTACCGLDYGLENSRARAAASRCRPWRAGKLMPKVHFQTWPYLT